VDQAPFVKGASEMAQPPLDQQLEQLHTELVQANVTADQPHPVLADLLKETQAVRANQGPIRAEQHATFRQRLSDALPQLEASHPTLTAAISEVLDTLSRMGL
jgi:uncharacterized protein DUF4404